MLNQSQHTERAFAFDPENDPFAEVLDVNVDQQQIGFDMMGSAGPEVMQA